MNEELRKKVEYYESLEAQGRLLILPEGKRPTVYEIMPECSLPSDWCPKNGGGGTDRCHSSGCGAYLVETMVYGWIFDKFGKTLFFNEEEARMKLAEREQ